MVCLIEPTILTTLSAIILVFMHSGVGNGHQQLYDAHSVPELHRGTAAIFLFY